MVFEVLGPRLAPQLEEPHREMLTAMTLTAMMARDADRRPSMGEVLNRLTAEAWQSLPLHPAVLLTHR